MARSREEMIEILTDKKIETFYKQSTWSDLVAAIQAYTPAQRNAFVQLLVSGGTRKAGTQLQKALYANAKIRAGDHVNTILADDTINLQELDTIL